MIVELANDKHTLALVTAAFAPATDDGDASRLAEMVATGTCFCFCIVGRGFFIAKPTAADQWNIEAIVGKGIYSREFKRELLAWMSEHGLVTLTGHPLTQSRKRLANRLGLHDCAENVILNCCPNTTCV